MCDDPNEVYPQEDGYEDDWGDEEFEWLLGMVGWIGPTGPAYYGDDEEDPDQDIWWDETDLGY